MIFFNPKEDVLDIELTQHGKRLLSQGKLKPSYYLFFDDDILYDANCASNATEPQKDIEGRIQEETPRLRTQYTFSELKEGISFDYPTPTPDRHFSLVDSLGTSDPLSNISPRWDIRLFGDDSPVITRATEYMTSSFGTLRIPQIDVEASFKTSISSEIGGPTIDEDPNLSSAIQADGTYISVQPRTILMQVLERHAVFEKENFDIEVYLSGSETESRVVGTPKLENWIPLSFKKKVSNIVDGVLMDKQPEICHDIDSTHVEYYFDIFVDKEINETIAENMESVVSSESMYLSTKNGKTSGGTFEIADIYSQVVPDAACAIADDECP